MKYSVRLGLIAIASLAVAFAAQAQTAILDYAADSAPRQQQNDWTGFVAAGVGMLPEYDGSEDYQTIPILGGQVNKGNYYIATRGLGLVANVIDSNRFNFGPVVRFRFGRDDGVDNARVASLREVDASLEAGAFVSAINRNLLWERDNMEVSLTAVQDIADGHGGLLADIDISYMVPVRRDLRIGFNTGTTYQSSDYMDSFFSVDANNSARSGLRQYSASSGFNQVGVGVNALYSFNQRWGLFTMLQYDRWLEDAADSPLVAEEGNENQLFGFAAISYRF